MENDIISYYQFGFLPGRLMQLAVFELLKQIYSAYVTRNYLVPYAWMSERLLIV